MHSLPPSPLPLSEPYLHRPPTSFAIAVTSFAAAAVALVVVTGLVVVGAVLLLLAVVVVVALYAPQCGELGHLGSL